MGLSRYRFKAAVNEVGLDLTAVDPVNMLETFRNHSRFDPSLFDSVSIPANFVRQNLFDSTWYSKSISIRLNSL